MNIVNITKRARAHESDSDNANCDVNTKFVTVKAFYILETYISWFEKVLMQPHRTHQ